MYSYVVTIEMDVNRAVLLGMIMPTLGLTIDSVEVVLFEARHNNVSELIRSYSVHFNPSCFF